MNKIYKEENINVNLPIIFNLINDVENYPSFLPWCINTEVNRETSDRMVGKIYISKNFIEWDFTTKNKIVEEKSIELSLVDGPFKNLDGKWSFTKIDENNTRVSLEINYEFKNSLIEISIEPIFTSIMNSILQSFIDQAFRIKYDD